MILGAKEKFFAPDYSEKMNGSHMMLWTIINGKIYFEKSPHDELAENQIHWTREFVDHFEMVIKQKAMPKKI